MKSTILFEVAAVVLLAALPAAAQHEAHHGAQKPPVSAKAPAKPAKGMSMPCAKMMQMHQADESSTKQQDAKLRKLMTAMNGASGDQKVSAMSAVITELVSQRAARQTRNAQRQSEMMGHMKQHMGQGGKMSMMQCPMMTAAGVSKSGMGQMGQMGHGMMKKSGK